MKNVSLVKVTAMVITVTFVSNFVNAKDKIIEKAQSEVVTSVEQLNFSALIAKLDSDKNSMLSQKEASVAQNQLLNREFSKIDINQDKQIDEAEFNRYLVAVNAKTPDLAKIVN